MEFSNKTRLWTMFFSKSSDKVWGGATFSQLVSDGLGFDIG